MQDRYTGDIGDFAKLGLLRALGRGYRLGVAWYLFPDETQNGNGQHITYLTAPDKRNLWQSRDPDLFNGLAAIVISGRRTVGAIAASGLLGDAVFSSAPLDFNQDRANARRQWFANVLTDLRPCDLVFADPDNGLSEDAAYRWGQSKSWKNIPLSEALQLAQNRTAVIYHHNSRRAGGHAQEIQHWLRRMADHGVPAIALYWRKISPRTFFILNPGAEIVERAEALVQAWDGAFELHTPPTPATAGNPHRCPECGHPFQGSGWNGIDAHWKSRHEMIMPYQQAWPIIRDGGKPSLVVAMGTQPK